MSSDENIPEVQVNVEPKIVTTRKSFKLGGEVKELLISFAAQQKIVTLYGGLESLNLLFTDPVIQTQAVAIVIFGKDFNRFETIEQIYESLSEYDSAETMPILIWLQAYFTNFTISQTQKLAETIQETQGHVKTMTKA